MSPPIRRSTSTGALIAVALAVAVPSAGCESAVKHPAITAGIVGGTLGFTTCKLGSDNNAACLAVTGGVAVFLGLVAATALWLGGDGNPSVLEEEPVQPLPANEPPRRRRHHPPAQPPAEPAPAAASPAPGVPAPAVPGPSVPDPAAPAPASPASANPVPMDPEAPTPVPVTPASPAAPTPVAPPAAPAPPH